MSLESSTYISGLNSSNPTYNDPRSQGDDHLRLIKSTILATFPNITGAVTPTHTELNYVDGVTSAIQTQLDAKVDESAAVFNGAITETVYTLTGTTPAFSAANGTIQNWTLTGNSSPTDSLTSGQSITLFIDDGTAYTITWPTITWINTAPTLATTGLTVINLVKNGTTLFGSYVGATA